MLSADDISLAEPIDRLVEPIILAKLSDQDGDEIRLTQDIGQIGMMYYSAKSTLSIS